MGLDCRELLKHGVTGLGETFFGLATVMGLDWSRTQREKVIL